ncbi:MAG: serine/threonine protein kinase, partial [Ramlibacter sp.]|nr:serine/threonine protein kinase [Ramlibacter sp.]
LVAADGAPVLLDFGIATALTPDAARALRLTLTGAGPGPLTAAYASPEQVRGGPVTTATDVYGLGLVLHEWLCGQPAHAGETTTELLCQHLLAPVPPLPARHAGWQPLLDAMLAKDAGRRPADGAAVLRQLKQLPCGPGPFPAGAQGPRNPS